MMSCTILESMVCDTLAIKNALVACKMTVLVSKMKNTKAEEEAVCGFQGW